MSEPVIQVTDQDVLAILGAKEVEITMLRRQMAAMEMRIIQLTPKPKKKKDEQQK